MSLQEEFLARHRDVQGVHRMSEEGGRTTDANRCMELKSQITRGYLKIATRSACKDPFGSLGFASERLEGIEPLKCSNGEGGQNHLVGVKFRWEDATSFGKKFSWS